MRKNFKSLKTAFWQPDAKDFPAGKLNPLISLLKKLSILPHTTPVNKNYFNDDNAKRQRNTYFFIKNLVI